MVVGVKIRTILNGVDWWIDWGGGRVVEGYHVIPAIFGWFWEENRET